MALTKLKTSGIADDAVTTDKLANAINTERTANTAKTSTTINNNADNRVITGSGTANTLEGESGLTYNGSSNLTISGSGQQQLTIGSTDAGGAVITLDGDSNGDGAGGDYSFIRHNTDGDLEFFARNTGGATNTIFKQSTTESMRIDSSGKVFIGDTSNLDSNKVNIFGTKAYSSGIPQQQLAVADAQAYNTTDNGGSIGFLAKFNSSGSYTTMGSIEGVKHNNIDGNYQGAIAFKTRNNNGDNVIRMRLTDNGLCFGTDTAGANALDDYEEGTFTPDWNGSSAGTTTYSTNQGSYTKIGNIVHIRMYSGINGTSGTGSWRVTNLPFSSPSGLSYITTGSCMVDGLDFDSNYTWVVPYKNSNSTLLDLYANTDNGGWDQVSISDDSSFAIILGITYVAA